MESWFHCFFLHSYQAARFLASHSLKQPPCHLWLGCLSGAAVILSIFSCTWLKLYICSKITELRKSCLPAAPSGKRHPEEQLIMDPMIFQSHCDCTGRFNQLSHRCDSQWIPFVSLIIRMNAHRKLI